MTDDITSVQQPSQSAPRWQPLRAIDRRVLGVLAEKAKTTPDIYPMSLNAIVTGANQKSNRDPVMQLEADDVQESLDRLREMGAVGMVEGYGRVTKFRHYLYEWLGVDKVELSVMAELLLRGSQTEGELRGRASRMDPIADLAALRAILVILKGKGLVVAITPEGRGHVVTHALYMPKELEQLRVQYSQQAAAVSYGEPEPAGAGAPARPTVPRGTDPALAAAAQALQSFEPLRREVGELRNQLAELHRQFDELSAQQGQMAGELEDLRRALGG